MPTIEYKIKGQKVSIDAIGFTGSACEAETREIEQKLGGVIDRTRKTEFYGKAERKATGTATHG